MEEQAGFLDAEAGKGFENVTQKDTVTPLLLISQQLSAVVDSGAVAVGHFYNSVTSEDYGDEVRLIICDFRRMWYAWKPNQQGLAGIYEPNSIEVTGDPFTGMTDKEGNKVEEKMVFIVVLADRPEEGYLVYTSTPGTIKYTKQWLTSARNVRLPSGKIAPLFGSIWKVKLNKLVSKDGNKYYGPAENGKGTFKFDGFISQVLYTDHVLPARQVAEHAALTADTQGAIEAPKEVETNF